MRSEPYPINGAVYRELRDGLVRIEDKASGKSGVFRFDGAWIEGDLTDADPHMLIYVGGPDLPPGRDIAYPLMPPLEEDIRAFPKTPMGAIALTEEAGQGPKVISPFVGDQGKETPEGMRSASFIPLDFGLEHERWPDLLPAVYRKSASLPAGPEKAPVGRYLDRKYHDLEVERLWSNVWRMQKVDTNSVATG